MLGRGGQFRDIACPYYASGLCERPHCHYKHEKPPQGNKPQVTTCRIEESPADEPVGLTGRLGQDTSFEGYRGFVGSPASLLTATPSTSTPKTKVPDIVNTPSSGLEEEGDEEEEEDRNDDTKLKNVDGGALGGAGEGNQDDPSGEQPGRKQSNSDRQHQDTACVPLTSKVPKKERTDSPVRRRGDASHHRGSPAPADKTQQLNQYARDIAQLDRKIDELKQKLQRDKHKTNVDGGVIKGAASISEVKKRPPEPAPYKPTKIKKEIPGAMKAAKYVPTPIAKLERRQGNGTKPEAHHTMTERVKHSSTSKASSSVTTKPTKVAPSANTLTTKPVDSKRDAIKSDKDKKTDKEKRRNAETKAKTSEHPPKPVVAEYQPKSVHLAAKLKEKAKRKRTDSKPLAGGNESAKTAVAPKMQTIDLFSMNVIEAGDDSPIEDDDDIDANDTLGLATTIDLVGDGFGGFDFPHDDTDASTLEIQSTSAQGSVVGDRSIEIGPLDSKRVAHKSSHFELPAKQKKIAPPSLNQQMTMRYGNLQKAKQQMLLEASVKRKGPTETTGGSAEKRSKQAQHEQSVHSASQLQELMPLYRQGVVGIGASTVPKGERRVAHLPKPPSAGPSSSASTPAVFPLEAHGSKVPLEVRQRYLKLFLDETMQLFAGDPTNTEAVTLAQTEEKNVLSRSSTKNSYFTAAANHVMRLRERVRLDRARKAAGGSPPSSSSFASSRSPPSSVGSVSHSAVLAGKGGVKSSYTVRRSGPQTKELAEGEFYERLQKYLLSEEMLVANGFPRFADSSMTSGDATIQLTDKDGVKRHFVEDNDVNRLCSRCATQYRLTPEGEYVSVEECTYHWGKAFQRRVRGASVAHSYTCCTGELSSRGCSVAPRHVTEQLTRSQRHADYVATTYAADGSDKRKVYAVDCEMVYSVYGPVLARVSAVDEHLREVLDVLVRPQYTLVDCNTRFSGLTREQIEGPDVATFDEAREKVLSLIGRESILIGHSLESDLKSMKIVHDRVIDTSVVFPHNRGPPYKRALRTLMVDYCKKIIQDSADGHDSTEDARACMELMLFKVKNE